MLQWFIRFPEFNESSASFRKHSNIVKIQNTIVLTTGHELLQQLFITISWVGFMDFLEKRKSRSNLKSSNGLILLDSRLVGWIPAFSQITLHPHNYLRDSSVVRAFHFKFPKTDQLNETNLVKQKIYKNQLQVILTS